MRHLKDMKQNSDYFDSSVERSQRDFKVNNNFGQHSILKYDSVEAEYAKKLNFRCEGW
jgi:hypothetical protein